MSLVRLIFIAVCTLVFKRILNIGPTTQALALRVSPAEVPNVLRGEGGSLVARDGFTVLLVAPSPTPRPCS